MFVCYACLQALNPAVTATVACSQALFPVAAQPTLTDALPVILQHPAVAANQQNICRLLQVCKAWKNIAQQTTSCLTHVSYSKELVSSSAEAVAAFIEDLVWFTRWVTSYAGIIRSINLDVDCCSAICTEVGSLRSLAQRVFVLGLKAAAAATHQSSLTADDHDAADAVCTSTCKQCLLQLRSFTPSSLMTHNSVLSALPAATLISLYISVPKDVQAYQSLAALSNLRSLRIDSSEGSLGEGYMTSINKLSRLTGLVLHNLKGTSGLPLLPRLLRQLDIYVDGDEEAYRWRPVTLYLSHLVRLQQLTAVITHPVEAALLPQQLQYLDVSCYSPAVSVLHHNLPAAAAVAENLLLPRRYAGPSYVGRDAAVDDHPAGIH